MTSIFSPSAVGELVYRTKQQHTRAEWLQFLKKLHSEGPKDLGVPLIADKYSTHMHAKVTAWLKRHNQCHMDFTPTSSSWTNLVDLFYSDLTGACIRTRSFTSVKQLTNGITTYLAERNEPSRPCLWKADVEESLATIHRQWKVLRGPEVLFDSGHYGAALAHPLSSSAA